MLIVGINANINLLGLMIQKSFGVIFSVEVKGHFFGSFNAVELKYTKMTPGYHINDTKCII